MEELQKEIFNITFTSNVWIDRTKEDYVSLVIHYIDNDWILRKRIIRFCLLDVSHYDVDITRCVK